MFQNIIQEVYKPQKVDINCSKKLTNGLNRTIIKNSDGYKTKDELCITLKFIEKECRKWTQFKENTLV